MRPVRLGAVLASAVALALGGGATTSVAEPVGGQSPRIIDGGYASNAPWAARLFVNGQENCTATIVAPTWILTAKHCVSTSATYTFNIGNLDQTKGTPATGTSIHRHSAADIALVQLDRSVQATYSPLGSVGAVSVDETVQVYGWGATCTNLPEIQCQSRLLKVADVKVTSIACSDYFGGIAVCANRVDGITAGGDSGGPMFATDSTGRYVQVGVASTSDRATRTAYTNITRYRDWISGIAGV